ncbi:AP-1 complex subunit beta-1-like [Zophobas morio]|uniref:AP-1 complex subunit beta-1-like n=1 Tax=Zophobas morio TaxID=2755281 RepID=UPI003083E402
MVGSKYFTTTKKGEIYELKDDLNSDNKKTRTEAVKKVIANMTVGKDVSSLFPDVVNCLQTEDLVLKKLVYLYLLNHAKTQPDLALLAVNTFQKDSDDSNPLIRALAIRTMSCIRVDKISEYLCNPLRKCLKDEDPYVRKTAAICVAKLYNINPQLVEDQGFLITLREFLSDSNPVVVANSVAALCEINAVSEEDVVLLNSGTLYKLLAALNECTEWGQIFILDCLATIEPKNSREAEGICQRVLPRLQHANPAVVLSAVKVVLKFVDFISDDEFLNALNKKLSPPLVTLLSSEAEVQYVALCNINIIIQKFPSILQREIKSFFVKYNDPPYVKLEKLKIMMLLASEYNVAQILSELKEYSTEVDVDFVRKAVNSIGQCAIKIESCAERCVEALMELIQTKVSYIVQEAVIVIKDILRKYPNQYERVIPKICGYLDALDDIDAKTSIIWIIGEYPQRVENADELLSSFLDSFVEEPAQVQLQLLSATVKLFLNKPQTTQSLLQRVLELSTNADNPDLRDRAYIYWRLLSADPNAARAVVLKEKPSISPQYNFIEPSLLDELIRNIGTLSSVYQKPASAFYSGRITGFSYKRLSPSEIENSPMDDTSAVSAPTLIEDLMNFSINNYNESSEASFKYNDDPSEEIPAGTELSGSTERTQKDLNFLFEL